MKDKERFEGFPKECVGFFRALVKNNNRIWFENHREDYQNFVKKPAEQFVVGMGAMLKKLIPGIIADPRTNKSLFRINRDTRFSEDKSPYKTHMGIYFWQAPFTKMESTGFYFHLEPPNLMLAAGIYMMQKPVLSLYRRTLSDEEQGANLMKIINRILRAGDYELGGKTYKKVPYGLDAALKHSELFLYSGLHTHIEMKIPPQFYTHECVDFCFKHFKIMSPLHLWLTKLMRRES